MNTKGRRKLDGSIDDGHDRDWRDYFFPRTGNVDEQGHEERMALPGYLKDLVAWYLEPTNSARNKLSPIVRVVAETLANRNFYNEKIWDGDNNTVPQNVLDELKHVGSYFLPMSLTGTLREHARGSSVGMQVGQSLGLRTAPSYITRSPAERYMAAYAAEHPMATSAPSAASKIERDVTRALRARRLDEASNLAAQALEQGKITEKELRRAIQNAETDPLTSEFNRLPILPAIEAARLMDGAERTRAMPLLLKKLNNAAKTLPPVELQHIVDKLNAAELIH